MMTSCDFLNKLGCQVEQRPTPQRVYDGRRELPLGQQRQIRKIIHAIHHKPKQERVLCGATRLNDEIVDSKYEKHICYNCAKKVDHHGRPLHCRNLTRKVALNHAQIRKIDGDKS